MPKIVKRGFVCAALAIAWVAAPGLRAQDKKELLPAPLPAQIFTARKVFVSNAGGDTLGDYSGGPDRAYNQLYTALKGATPILGETVSGGGAGHASVSSNPVKDPQFRLAIRDLKTHVLLWTFTEHVQSALLQGNRDKNFDQAMAALVNDIKNVAGQPAPTASSPSK